MYYLDNKKQPYLFLNKRKLKTRDLELKTKTLLLTSYVTQQGT